MEGFKLSSRKLKDLRLAHRNAKSKKDVRLAYKINAIILLGSGWTMQTTSDALLLSEDTLRNYIQKYNQDGVAGLAQLLYRGSESFLNEEQIQILCNELDTNIHLTTLSICNFVESKFNIKYSQSGMNNLLHKLGFTYKKPKLVPASADEEKKEEFLKFYQDFIENKPKDELLLFADGVHPQHNSMPSYGWIRKGEIRELQSNTGRSRLNIHGAMNAETFETTIIYSESNIDKYSTVSLLSQLKSVYPYAKKIHLILDNAKYHYSKEVINYADANNINLVYLPPYAPDLNLIERLWRIFKKNVLYNKFYEKFKDFKKACVDFFNNQKNYLSEIRSIMGNGLEDLCCS